MSSIKYNSSEFPYGDLERSADAALEMGWALIPLDGKIPRLTGWQAGPAAERDQVLQWIHEGHNLGVRTGSASKIVVIDDDTDEQRAAEELGLPECPMAVTGRDRRHYYFRAPEAPVRNSAGTLLEKVDVRGDGGQIVLPGSIHPDTGQPYRWADGRSPAEIPLPDLPAHVLERLATRPKPRGRGQVAPRGGGAAARRALRAAQRKVRHTPEGRRNDSLNETAFLLGEQVRSGSLDASAVEESLFEAALEAGLDEDEASKTIASGLTAGIEKARSWPTTDSDNADRLVEAFGDEILFCGSWGRWLVWTGQRWERDDLHRLQAMCKEVARGLAAEARFDDDPASSRRKWARSSANVAGLDRMADAARDLVAVRHEELDQDPWSFNVANGTLDLRTGELRPHDPKDRITKLDPVPFDPDAPCPQWDRFLAEVLPDDQVRAFVQRAVGCSMVGELRDQVLFFCLGEGANGKTTFLNALQGALGRDYVRHAAADLLVERRFESHPTELADLWGARMVVCSELPPGCAFDEARLKRLTGGDPIKARRMCGVSE